MSSKSIFTSKTFLLAVLQAVAGSSAALMSTDPTIRMAGVAAVLKSVIDILLRLSTSDPTHILSPS